MKFCEICELDFEYLDEHHIQSKCYGGTNDPYNKCNICPNCHKTVHYGQIVIEGKFMTCTGIKLIWRNNDEESITDIEDPKVYIISKEK